MLKVNNINVYYGSIHAIKDVSFEVHKGEVVTLIGANGAGKSTILQTVSGLLHSKTGSVEFLGQNISAVRPDKIVSMGLAHVPEGRRVFLQLTVEENLEMGAYTRPGSEFDASIKDVYERFPRLLERRKQVAGTLSGGEQQRVAIARALITINDYTINTGGRNWCFGFSDRWKDIMNTPKSYPVVSGLIDQLSEDDSPVSLYDKLRKIIDNYLTNYDLNKKDSRYYIAKYPDSLQAMHDGHNIIFFEAGWDNYWIDVINKDRMSSYHINLFRYLVYKYYPLTKDFNQWLELKNGLTLDCAEQHGWCIKYSDKVKTEFVEEQFKGYPLKPNREEKLFFIPVDLKEDLIEAGIGILEKMTQIP